MANPHRGQVDLVAGEKTYTLAYTINSVCELEEKLDKPLSTIVSNMGRLSVVRAVLWAGLLHHHKVSMDEAGSIMDEAGAAETMAAINKAVTAAFPVEDKATRKNR